jgi:microcystin-dependent protein
MPVQVRPQLVLAMLASAAALHLVLAACGQSSSNTAQCQSGNCNTGSSSGGAGPAPSGAILAFGGSTAPDGWLICDGSTVSRTQYPSLFAAIGVAHGSGDGATTFNLPDYQGRFLRGVDHGTGRDPDAATRTAANLGGNVGDEVGSLEADAFASHTHGVTDPGHSHGVSDPGHAHGVNDPGHQHGVAAGQYYTYYNGSTCSGENFGFTNGGGTCFDVNPGSGAAATHVTIAGSQTGVTVDSQITGVGVSASGASTETRPVNADVVWIIKT